MRGAGSAVIALVALLFAAGERATGETANPLAPAAGITEKDKDFMAKAAGGGIAEVEMAKLALEKASSPEVKKHAQHMIDDHTKSNEELKSLASKKSVTLPATPDEKHKATIDRLRGLSGQEFDKEYIREAGLHAHKEMQTLFKDAGTSAEDADVKAFAQKTLGVVEEHLGHSEKLAAAAGVSANASTKSDATAPGTPATGAAAENRP